MIQIPDVLCEMQNLICRAVRAIAYVALEIAQVAVRVAMLAFDAAKFVVTVAQLAVDKAKLVLIAAQGLLEIAKTGLEVAKVGLELATVAIEAVKFTVKAALYVFELLVSGIQNLIDVRNCGFEIQMSAKDRSFFEVSCDVKAFNLGWTTFSFEFDFKNPIASIWRVAKSTLNHLLDAITNILGKRKKKRTIIPGFHQNLSYSESIQKGNFKLHGISKC